MITATASATLSVTIPIVVIALIGIAIAVLQNRGQPRIREGALSAEQTPIRPPLPPHLRPRTDPLESMFRGKNDWPANRPAAIAPRRAAALSEALKVPR